MKSCSSSEERVLTMLGEARKGLKEERREQGEGIGYASEEHQMLSGRNIKGQMVVGIAEVWEWMEDSGK